MNPLTDKQKKAGWIIALVLVVVHFAPSLIHATSQALTSQFHSASLVKPLPARTVPGGNVSIPQAAATAPPANATAGRFLGIWEGSQFRPALDQCRIRLELRPSQDVPGQISGYETRTCFDSAYVVGGTRLPQGGLQQLMTNANPVSTVLTGTLNASEIALRVDKIVGSTPSQCPLTDYAVSLFGDAAIVAQWKAGNCPNGAGQIVLTRTR